MLRRGVSQQRNTSVCAFCQHRLLALPRARIPQRRLLSSTRHLRDNGSSSTSQDAAGSPPGATPMAGTNPAVPGAAAKSGWGKPMFGSGIADVKETPSTNGAPNNSVSQKPISVAPDLLPHEIEARRRFGALKAAEARAAEQRAAELAPKPGEPKFVFNPKRQQKIMEDIQAMKDTKYIQESLAGTPSVTPPVKLFSLTSLRRKPRLLRPAIRPPEPGGRLRDGTVRELPIEKIDMDAFKEKVLARPAAPMREVGNRFALRPDIGKPELSFNVVKTKSSDTRHPWHKRLVSEAAEQDESSNIESKGLKLAGLTNSSDFFLKKPQQEKIQNSASAILSAPDNSLNHQTGERGADYSLRNPSVAPGTRSPSIRRNGKVFDNTIYRSNDHNSGAWNNGDNYKSLQWPPARSSTLNSYGSNQPQAATSSSTGTWDFLARKQQTGSKTPSFNHSVDPSANGTQPLKTGTGSAGTWGSLSRKQQPEKPKDDFWGAFESNISSLKKTETKVSKQTPPLEDWGKEFDNMPKRKLTVEPISSKEKTRKQNEADSVDDWTIRPASGARTEAYQENNRDRRQDPDRVERFEIGSTRDRKGGKKRSQRNSRYDDAEDDHGLDDSFEDYVGRRQKKEARKAQREAERIGPRPIVLPELINISNLASALKIEKNLFLTQLGELGFESVSLDSIMAGETAALVAQEYGFEPTVESGQSQDLKPRPPPEDPSILPPRPPVVTIMGHVDHGKTTLLDYLRKSSVAAQEHGGITQHIGAFSVKMSTGKQITFLDTPGHAAFLTMRQRGANVTDIVVLVVAADDSVKPQTIEALKHARAAKVPIIVAINKIDKEGAQIDRVKADLAARDVEIEDYGGDVQVVCVSGRTGQGMDNLEESILTLSEILDMRAEEDGPAEGWILESSLKPIGKAATILVKRGTLRPGDYIAAGTTFAKIRHLRNEAGVEINEAPPGTPVEILGWRDLPAAGDQVIQALDERSARSAVSYREGLREREKDAADHEVIAEQRKLLQEQRQAEKAAEVDGYKRTDGNWGTVEKEVATEGGPKVINFVVKGDVHGSVEAVCACILEIGSHEVGPRVLRSAPGHITESDVEHAATSKSTLVNFNLPISGQIKRQAEEAGVKILDHTVIYHLADDVKDTLSSHLEDDVSYKVLGEAEVLQVFPINVKARKYKNIAGCRVRNGRIERNDLFRVFRGGEKLFEGKLESLKHGKKDANEAKKDGECGIGFELFQDLKVGDKIQAVEEVRTQRTL